MKLRPWIRRTREEQVIGIQGSITWEEVMKTGSRFCSWFKSLFSRLRRVPVDGGRPAPSTPPSPQPAYREPVPARKPKKETAGIRNKNPLNVKGKGWQGQVGNDSRGHAIFRDEIWGTRAAIVTLRTYWLKHKKRTVAEILSRWAPTSDTIGSIPGAPPNSPVEYARFVEKRTGLKPNEELRLFDFDGEVWSATQLYKLVAAMAEYENFAGHHLPQGTFLQALEKV